MIYRFDEVQSMFDKSEWALMHYIKANGLEYSKMGQTKFLTQEQFDKLLESTTCSSYTNEENIITSEEPSHDMINQSQYGNLQASVKEKRRTRYFNL